MCQESYAVTAEKTTGTKMKHCEMSEQCVDDVYCNCPCEQCQQTLCYRPGCSCSKRHASSNWSGELWIDDEGFANFKFHIQGGQFTDAREALRKFIACLQDRLDKAERCPFYQPEQEATVA